MSFNSIKRLTHAILITYSFAFLFFFFLCVILRSSHGYHKLARRSLNCAKERTEKKGSSHFARRQSSDWPSISGISCLLITHSADVTKHFHKVSK